MDFFEGLGKKLSKTYNVASEKAEKVTKQAKLKMNISEYQSKVDEVYLGIGKEFYEKYLEHRDNEVALEFIKEFKTIDNYKEKINLAEKEILELKELKICKKCGVQYENKFEYCPKCGTKYEEIVYETEIVKKEEE